MRFEREVGDEFGCDFDELDELAGPFSVCLLPLEMRLMSLGVRLMSLGVGFDEFGGAQSLKRQFS